MVKRVLFVLKHFNFGGTERYAVNLANVLVERGVSVVIVGGHGPLESFVSPKVKIVFAPIGRQNGSKRISEKIILDVSAQFKPQLIHAQCRNSLLCCQLARRYLNIPVICHEHLAYKENEYPFVVDELDVNSDKVITIAPYIAQKLIDHGLKRNRVDVLFNGVNINDFPPITKAEKKEARDFFELSSTNRVIVCLSRIVPGKDIKKLVDAFTLISRKLPSARLIIAGDDEWGVTKGQVERQVKKRGLNKKLLIYPAQFDIRKFHAVADVFCYPPISRGMAVMEAMASGLPIVAKEPFQKEPIVAENKISGMLVQTDSVNELANQLMVLLKNKDLANQMGAAARKTIENKFNLEDNISEVVDVYQQVIDGNDQNADNFYRNFPHSTQDSRFELV